MNSYCFLTTTLNNLKICLADLPPSKVNFDWTLSDLVGLFYIFVNDKFCKR